MLKGDILDLLDIIMVPFTLSFPHGCGPYLRLRDTTSNAYSNLRFADNTALTSCIPYLRLRDTTSKGYRRREPLKKTREGGSIE